MGVTVPVFGVTGNALLSDQARFMAAGVTKVFTKPVSKASITAAVQLAREAKMARLATASR
jgi:osomolarity two-component system sensor histidine kinase SLN1